MDPDTTAAATVSGRAIPDWFIKPEDFSRELTKDDLEFLAAMKHGREECARLLGMNADVAPYAIKGWSLWISAKIMRAQE